MKKLIAILAIGLLVTSCSDEEQLPLTLDTGVILNEMHRSNIGKIAFMKNWIPIDKFKQHDFLDEISLSSDSDFGIRLFLDKSLTYYLNQLEPDLSVRELCDKGNFQVSFLVDDKEVYTNNLPTGAGSCEYKNATTSYGIPLINKNNPDHWGRFLWVKFLRKGGGQQALAPGRHKLTVKIRPYIQHEQLKVGGVIAQGEVNLSLVEKEVSESQKAIQKIQPTDKWQISEAKYDEGLIRKLNEKIAQNYFKNITSIVVIKHGELLIEEYFNGVNRNSLHDTRSVGKTLASTIMGIAIGDGYIESEHQTLAEFYQLVSYENYSPIKDKVTLKGLLTMSSGFAGSDREQDSAGNEENMYPTSDWVKFVLDLPMDSNKVIGKNWDYLTGGAVILGDVLDKSVPNGLQKYAQEKLFKPLGINQYKWQFTPTNVPNTAGGFQMSALNNARWGQLYIDNGRYANKQILPKNWVELSLTKQIQLPEVENEFYSYLFWNKQLQVNNRPFDIYYASGNGGNRIVIQKDLGVVIVLTATAYNQPFMHHQADEIIGEYLLPSIK
jgi:CubicO group peptidase (beta-lactamase class C family)